MSIEFSILGDSFQPCHPDGIYIFISGGSIRNHYKLGILMGLLTATWAAKKTAGQNPDDYTNIALLGIVLGLIGAGRTM